MDNREIKKLLLLFTLLTSSCALVNPVERDLSPRQIESRNLYIAGLNTHVVSPIFHFNRFLCTYHKENGSWPVDLTVDQDGPYFENIDLLDREDGSIKIDLELKAVVPIVSYELSESDGSYTTKINVDEAGYSGTYECSEKALMAVDTIKISKIVASMNKITEVTRKRRLEQSSLAGKVQGAMLQAGLCLVLGIRPESCN